VHSCCSDQSCSAYFEDPPPPFLSNNMSCRMEIRPLANHTDFVSGRFLAEKTFLVGYWKLRILRKDEIRNR
jgi:hypothetical protein